MVGEGEVEVSYLVLTEVDELGLAWLLCVWLKQRHYYLRDFYFGRLSILSVGETEWERGPHREIDWDLFWPMIDIFGLLVSLGLRMKYNTHTPTHPPHTLNALLCQSQTSNTIICFSFLF